MSFDFFKQASMHLFVGVFYYCQCNKSPKKQKTKGKCMSSNESALIYEKQFFF
eukprot:TRINITY_DN82_c0_g1_i1.p1 TRINITY_DN82_c0_g1~~TRINITY_DN82_c0_g1_i1.p1  ORF type:complete len:53 (-),score=9.14 TRINITY_DN82_c0_g1_i1:35-193(-)